MRVRVRREEESEVTRERHRDICTKSRPGPRAQAPKADRAVRKWRPLRESGREGEERNGLQEDRDEGKVQVSMMYNVAQLVTSALKAI